MPFLAIQLCPELQPIVANTQEQRQHLSRTPSPGESLGTIGGVRCARGCIPKQAQSGTGPFNGRKWVWLWSPHSHCKPKHGRLCSPVGRATAPPKQEATSAQLSRQGRKDDRCHRPRLPVTGNQLPPVSSSSSPRTRTNSPAELLLPDLPPAGLFPVGFRVWPEEAPQEGETGDTIGRGA